MLLFKLGILHILYTTLDEIDKVIKIYNRPVEPINLKTLTELNLVGGFLSWLFRVSSECIVTRQKREREREREREQMKVRLRRIKHSNNPTFQTCCMHSRSTIIQISRTTRN